MNPEKFQTTNAEPSTHQDGKIVWTIIEPVVTHDGGIFFYDEKLQCYFDIKIKQTKGEGAYYYESVKKPDSDHIEIMKMMQFLKAQNRTWKQQELFNQLKLYHNTFGIKKEIKISPFLGRLSEFVRKKIIVLDKDSHYKINHQYISKILESGQY